MSENYENLFNGKYKICDDNIIRKRVGKKWNPAAPNSVLQPLVEKLQDEGKLTPQEETLYGQCILSLVEIVTNNRHIKYQTDIIKDECRGEALECVLTALPKNFDRNRGSTAYSYAFRCIYTAMIHVLDRWNEKNEHEIRLDESILSNLVIEDENEEIQELINGSNS